MDKMLYVISHTHWDREWYQTFEVYRRRLVRFLDDLIDLLENDPEYKHFHLDGQTILLEDYLEIRPYNKDRLYKLIRDNRIIIGPWYVMPDEFLISGESLIRNMQHGMKICEDIGVPPLRNGYVVDIFGHNSQFPQFLKSFNIDTAILFRGIADYEKDIFIWQGADGSEIMTSKLDKDRAYSNFYFAIRWPFDEREYDDDEIVERMKKLLESSNDSNVSDILLMMDGVDHIDADPNLPRIMKLLESNIPGIKLIHASLEDYFKAQIKTNPQLETIKGPLYNVGKAGINNTVLKNVLSSIVEIKQANDNCEILLTKWAEPLDFALGILKNKLLENKKYKSMEPRNDFLQKAWKELLKNHPHDSICGCSKFDVHSDNEYRYRQVRDIAVSLKDDSKRVLADNINTEGQGKAGAVIFFNAGQTDYKGVTIFDFNAPQGHQYNFKFYDINGDVVPYQICGKKQNIENIFEFRELIRFKDNDLLKIAMEIEIPALGYVTYTYDDFRTEWPGAGDYTYKKFCEPTRYLGSLKTGINAFDTGKIEVTVNPNGTLKIKNKETNKEYDNVLAIEDCGDEGDGWNYRKPFMDSSYIGLCGNVDFSIETDGPLVSVLKISRRMMLPKELCGRRPYERSGISEEFTFTSFITLSKDSSRLDIHCEVNNQHLEHRVRVLIPTYLKADTFFTKTPFDMQEWNVKADDWSNYNEIDTNVHPSQGVTLLSDEKDSVALYTRGLYEVEITDNLSRTIALTLFRTFNNEVNCQTQNKNYMKKKFVSDYSIDFAGARNPHEVIIAGENYRCGIENISTSIHKGNLPLKLSFTKIVSNNNTVISALVRDYQLKNNSVMSIIRLFDASSNGDNGYIEFPELIKSAYYIDFEGNILKEAKTQENKIYFNVGAKKIITIAFE